MGIKDPSLDVACSPRPHPYTEPSLKHQKFCHHEERVVGHYAVTVDDDSLLHQRCDIDGHFGKPHS